jgi:hypothetical protein
MSATVHSLASDAWVDQVRSVSIEDEIRRRGIKLKRQGSDELVGPCPKCGGDDRFSINTKKNVFNCDVIDLVKHLDGSDFLTACTTLAGKPPSQRSNAKGHCRTAQGACSHIPISRCKRRSCIRGRSPRISEP